MGAIADGTPGPELVELVRWGRLSAEKLPRALVLGCGAGAAAVFLAEYGFHVTGIDRSRGAVAEARRRAGATKVADRLRFVAGDVRAASLCDAEGPFDLLVDHGTLADLRPKGRLRAAATVKRLSRTGARFFLWCIYTPLEELPRFSFSRPSRWAGSLVHGEEQALFADAFTIRRLEKKVPEARTAAFLMTRK